MAASTGDHHVGPGNASLQVKTFRPLIVELAVEDGGAVSGTIPLSQSDWGIKPYRGLMGALKVRDEVQVVIEARLPDQAAA